MNRTDRLFALLLEIQSHPRITAGQLASRFDVTKRTVYRDVLALMEAGVPVAGKAGSGYAIEEGYFLPPVTFTREEALMLSLGVNAAGRQFDAHYRRAARSAEAKIRSVLPPGLKKEIAYLLGSINLYSGEQKAGSAVTEALEKVRRAVIEGKRLVFRYYKRSGDPERPMVRQVDPYLLANFFGSWSVSGYDPLRKDIRMFRLDRMDGVMVSEKRFQRPKKFRPELLYRDDPSQEREYVVRIDRSLHRWVKEQPPYRIVRTRTDAKHVTLTIASSSQAQVAAWTLRWGSGAEAVSPASFREAVRATAASISRLYE